MSNRSGQARHFVAVDIGSNSFHLVIARQQDGNLQLLHQEKEYVRLAEGLDEQGILDKAAIQRGVQCLSNFNQRLTGIKASQIRIVATHTLRVARNRDEFLAAAQAVIPYPIEIASGHDEAKLIYNGISHTESLAKLNLVIDIGGGSTEVVIGRKTSPIHLSSLPCGSASLTKGYFSDGRLTKKAFKQAEYLAIQHFTTLRPPYFSKHWEKALGSSGTVKSVSETMAYCFDSPTITLERLLSLKEQLINWGSVDAITWNVIEERRKHILAAGIAILISFFRSLGLQQLEYTQGAMREGILFSMVKLDRFKDIRERTVKNMASLYHIDEQKSKAVTDTAAALLSAAADEWGLTSKNTAKLLSYASRLHQIGIHINSKKHYLHGAYIIRNSKLPGFNPSLQQEVALLIGNQTKKPDLHAFDVFRREHRLMLFRVLALLRLAIVLNLGSHGKFMRFDDVKVFGDVIELKLDRHNPQLDIVIKDLEHEAKHLKRLGVTTVLRGV